MGGLLHDFETPNEKIERLERQLSACRKDHARTRSHSDPSAFNPALGPRKYQLTLDKDFGYAILRAIPVHNEPTPAHVLKVNSDYHPERGHGVWIGCTWVSAQLVREINLMMFPPAPPPNSLATMTEALDRVIGPEHLPPLPPPPPRSTRKRGPGRVKKTEVKL